MHVQSLCINVISKSSQICWADLRDSATYGGAFQQFTGQRHSDAYCYSNVKCTGLIEKTACQVADESCTIYYITQCAEVHGGKDMKSMSINCPDLTNYLQQSDATLEVILQ